MAEALEGRLALSASGSANPVLTWNAIALQAIRTDKTPPPIAGRDLAIVQIAVEDAVGSVVRSPWPALVRVASPRGASVDAAASAAAHRALSSLFPAQAATFDAALAASLDGILDGPAEQAGVAVGRSVADAVVALRAGDGSGQTVRYTPATFPGDWRPTPPSFAPALLPQWPGVRPFALRNASQLRPPGMPSLTSPEYAAAVAEVESLGAKDSTVRTADQTQIALFWADGAGTETPPGHWNAIADDLASRKGLSVVRSARMLATLDVALADAGIAAWDAKYAVNCWRPISAIRSADQDGNPATTADTSWTPLLTTPPFPSYVSGHSTFSAAAAEVLSAYFGPRTRFTATSDALPGVTRSFRSFRVAADEAGVSRIYGGIHFSFDTRDGLARGRSIGRYVLQRSPGK